MTVTEKMIEAGIKAYVGNADITEAEARPEVIRILSAAFAVVRTPEERRWRVFEDTTHGYWGIELEQAGNDDDPILHPTKVHRDTVARIVDAHNAALAAAEPSETVDVPFNAIRDAYIRGATWYRQNNDGDIDIGALLHKAAYDYADAATGPTPSPADRGAVEALRGACAKAADDALISAIHAVYENGAFSHDALLAPAEVRSRVSSAIAALALPAAEGVKVKPLVWEAYDPDTTAKNGHSGRRIVTKARHPYGVYTLETEDSLKWWVLLGFVGKDLSGPFTTEVEAKAAAQAHHDATILSALAAPSQAREGDRVAELEEALSDLVSWFPEKPLEPVWQLKAGQHGADDAIAAARAALGDRPHD